MAIFEVIKYEGPNDVLAWKSPYEDFNTKSQLIVHEAQEAIFFKNGEALDLFGTGRHTLDTQNIPLLNKLINLPFGGTSPFHCEVYFINKTNSMDIRWGTSNHILVQDPIYNVILPVGANGQFSVQIEDSRKFLCKIVGCLPTFTQDELLKYFRGLLMTNIKDYIAKAMVNDKVSFLEIHSHLREISSGISNELALELAQYGIKLTSFYVASIIIPEDDPTYVKLRSSLDKRAEMGILGTNYAQMRTFDVLEGAAKNESSNANAFMGAGLGLGMGANLGNVFGNAINGMVNSSEVTVENVCIKCGQPLKAGSKFCSSCGAEQIKKADTVICPNCGKSVPAGKFCNECGAQLNVKKFCPDCGSEVTGAFCSNCGRKL